MRQIRIFDTTMRDGEQSPGCSMNPGEKLQVAKQLEKLGVDVIEAGFPISSPEDFQAVQAIAKAVKNSVVCGLARCVEADVRRAYEAVKEAAKKIYRLLACQGFARVDMFLTEEGEPVFIECNTIPGLTVHSQYPRMMAAAGLAFPQVVERLVELALEARP